MPRVRPAGRSTDPGWRGWDPISGTSAKAAWGVFAGWPWRAPSTCPGAWAVLSSGRGAPARCWEGSRYHPATGDPASTGRQPAAQVLSHDILRVGHRREPADPPAAWPRVTEITHESQKFVQTHPPPASEDKRSEAGRQEVLRAGRTGAAPGAAPRRRQDWGHCPGSGLRAPSSSGRPTCATAGPPGYAQSSRPRRRRPRAAG